MFWGEPSDAARERFEVTTPSKVASNGNTVWKGFRRMPWASYEAGFLHHRKEFDLVYTDLVCVKKDRLEEFERALEVLS